MVLVVAGEVSGGDEKDASDVRARWLSETIGSAVGTLSSGVSYPVGENITT